MKTSQSFPFYPSDFILGTMLLSAEEVGAYIRLLCFQWEQGSIPTDPMSISKIAGVSTKRLGPVLAKFILSGDGYRNARLERVRTEREAYQKRQSDLGKKGGRPKANPFDDGKGLKSQPFLENEAKSKLPSPSPSPSPLPLYSPEPPAMPSLNLEGEETIKPMLSHEQIEVASLVGRRPTTPWSDKELKSWAKVSKPIDPEDWAAIRWYYSESGCDHLRRDLVTLLNNWNGEIDRAKNYTPPTR